LEEILDRDGLSFDSVASIGDDLNDYMMLKNPSSHLCQRVAQTLKGVVDTILIRDGDIGAQFRKEWVKNGSFRSWRIWEEGGILEGNWDSRGKRSILKLGGYRLKPLCPISGL